MIFQIFFILYIQNILNLPVFEVFIIAMNDNITQMERSSYYFKTKGLILTFDPYSNISSIPLQIHNEIKNGFHTIYPGTEPYEKDLENGYQVFISHAYDETRFPSVNFILSDRSITIPSKYLFKSKGVFEFVFLINENEDKIIIGKDLIDLMNVEFINENEFFIHNREFVIKIKDDI